MGETMIHEELSRSIIGASMTVLNALRPGLSEKLYERALIIELTKQGHRRRTAAGVPCSLFGTIDRHPETGSDRRRTGDRGHENGLGLSREPHRSDDGLPEYHRLETGSAFEFSEVQAGMEAGCSVIEKRFFHGSHGWHG